MKIKLAIIALGIMLVSFQQPKKKEVKKEPAKTEASKKKKPCRVETRYTAGRMVNSGLQNASREYTVLVCD